MGVAALEKPPLTAYRIVAADAPAKINLTLEVLGKRSDGYHDLRSLVIGVDLRDRIECAASHPFGPTLDCSDPTLHGDDNLACRAAVALALHCGCDAEVRIRLDKCIPVGAGLGGGSSDAATTLRLCGELWRAGLNDAQLATVGAEVGSDVPLFFNLPSALIRGRGERVERLSLRWSGWVLLIFPGVHVATADVYRAWRAGDAREAGAAAADFIGDIQNVFLADELHGMLTNQLEPAVFRVCPRVAEARDELQSLGVSPIRVTGSGSALYRLFDDPEAARDASDRIERRFPRMKTAVVAAPVGVGPIEHKEKM
jgi:4-diphosphocytidyl-2-C-methyl-D-erythritol kinase